MRGPQALWSNKLMHLASHPVAFGERADAVASSTDGPSAHPVLSARTICEKTAHLCVFCKLWKFLCFPHWCAQIAESTQVWPITAMYRLCIKVCKAHLCGSTTVAHLCAIRTAMLYANMYIIHQCMCDAHMNPKTQVHLSHMCCGHVYSARVCYLHCCT